MSQKKPPRIARFLLKLFSDYRNRFFMAGDIEEAFRDMAVEKGAFHARLWYWKQCLGAFPMYVSFQNKKIYQEKIIERT